MAIVRADWRTMICGSRPERKANAGVGVAGELGGEVVGIGCAVPNRTGTSPGSTVEVARPLSLKSPDRWYGGGEMCQISLRREVRVAM